MRRPGRQATPGRRAGRRRTWTAAKVGGRTGLAASADHAWATPFRGFAPLDTASLLLRITQGGLREIHDRARWAVTPAPSHEQPRHGPAPHGGLIQVGR